MIQSLPHQITDQKTKRNNKMESLNEGGRFKNSGQEVQMSQQISGDASSQVLIPPPTQIESMPN